MVGFIVLAIGIGDVQAKSMSNGIILIGVGLTMLSADGYAAYKSKMFMYSGSGGILLILIGYTGSVLGI